MNLSEIRTTCRQLLNEDTPGFWSDAKLNAYINLAAMRVNSIISSTREDFFTQSATFATVAGQKSYTLPEDCRFIRRMEMYDSSDSSSIIKMDELRFPRTEANGDWMFVANGQPQRFYVIGNHFDLFPIPEGTFQMRMFYDVRQVQLATNTDVPSVPLDFHDMIVFWACVLAKKQNEDDDAGFVALFNMRKEELIETIVHRAGEDARTVESYLEGII
jgi:hypothetical protein